MKKGLLFTLLMLPLFIVAQNMSNAKLDKIYTGVSDSIQGRTGAWQFYVNEVQFISITDSIHNRMRIISPITSAANLSDDLLRSALVANFHTALDVKYAVTDGL